MRFELGWRKGGGGGTEQVGDSLCQLEFIHQFNRAMSLINSQKHTMIDIEEGEPTWDVIDVEPDLIGI